MVIFQFRDAVHTEQSSFSQSEANSKKRKILNNPIELRDSIIIKNSPLRNPFQRIIKESPEKKMVIKKHNGRSNKTTTEIYYIGFLSDGKGLLALLEFADGVTIISREGEIHGNISIRDIRKESIKIVDQGKELVIPIKQ
jgi:hypothetical protein